MARHSLTLYDYSDRELLHMMMDEADGDGWVSSTDLALVLGIDSKHARMCVSQRLSWLRRYGAVDRHPEESGIWRLTRTGMAQALGDLSPEQKEVVEGLSAEQMLTLTRSLTNRYRRVGNTAAHLMRREWQYGTHGRKF
jgi:hypothetical protein